MRKLNIIEMYAGAGRSSSPFKRWRRAQTSLLVDWNTHACATYKHNYKNAPYVTADLSKMTSRRLQSLVEGKVDIVLGCPPCQGFSESGKRHQQDDRNDHVKTFIKLATELKPAVIAMENVPLAVISSQFKQGTRVLERSGYVWTAGILNAASYGSVQARCRLIMIAVRKDIGVDPELPLPTHVPVGKYFDYAQQRLRLVDEDDEDFLGKTSSSQLAEQILDTNFYEPTVLGVIPVMEDVLAGLPKLGTEKAQKLSHWTWTHGKRILDAMKNVPEGGRRRTEKEYYGAAYARLHRKGLARTITTCFPNAGSGRFWHPTENRALSLREAARVQGFPDDFSFISGPTAANATLVGNALDNALATANYLAIRRILE